jgi:hypothetical protein
MGTPQDPLAEQYARLEAGGLELLEPPRWVSAIGSKIDLVWSKYSNLLKPRVMALPPYGLSNTLRTNSGPCNVMLRPFRISSVGTARSARNHDWIQTDRVL